MVMNVLAAAVCVMPNSTAPASKAAIIIVLFTISLSNLFICTKRCDNTTCAEYILHQRKNNCDFDRSYCISVKVNGTRMLVSYLQADDVADWLANSYADSM